MDARDKLLESLGLEVSDGAKTDWRTMEASLPSEGDHQLLRDLRSLSLMAEFYRKLRRDTEGSGHATEAPSSMLESARDTDTGPGAAPGTPPGAGGQSALRPGTHWGHLEILEEIGRGTYGEVYRARDTRLNREVALKLLRGHAEEALTADRLFEGEHLARVKHPNLVVVHGAARREGRTGLWMEHVRGTTLQELVRSQGPLGAREAGLLGIDLCGALAALHSAGLVHRDVKAQNVMRELGGRVVLMDLGSGTEVPEAPEAPEDDRTDRDAARRSRRDLSGTPLYMAPETLSSSPASVRSDIYSLGVLLFYAATGTYPVTAGSLADLREKHARHERRHLRDVRPDLPPPFVAIIERAIAADPGQRFASAGEMEHALSAAIRNASGDGAQPRLPASPFEAAGLGTEVRSARGARPRPSTILLAGLAAALLAAVALFIWPGPLAGGAYTIEATLHRGGSGGEELLLPGTRVSPGDRLFLEFEASRAMHVYILAEDDAGEAFLLFPLPGLAQGNPLPGDARHRFPPDRDGRRYSWGVSSAGGTEHLLIVASPKPLTDFERGLAALPAPQESGTPPAVRLDREALSGLRGIGLLVETEPTPEPRETRAVFAVARRLGSGPEQARDVWVRQIDLINPGP